MKIVITGGCGFLGVGIARKLMDRPEIDSLVLFDAHVPDALPNGLDDRVTMVEGDISDRVQVAAIIDRDDIAGPVNLTSPRPSDNRTLMRELRRAVGMPIGIPAWRFMLEPAMWVLRTEPELVLKSRWTLPGVLERAGYRFRHPHLRAAIRASR